MCASLYAADDKRLIVVIISFSFSSSASRVPGNGLEFNVFSISAHESVSCVLGTKLYFGFCFCILAFLISCLVCYLFSQLYFIYFTKSTVVEIEERVLHSFLDKSFSRFFSSLSPPPLLSPTFSFDHPPTTACSFSFSLSAPVPQSPTGNALAHLINSW